MWYGVLLSIAPAHRRAPDLELKFRIFHSIALQADSNFSKLLQLGWRFLPNELAFVPRFPGSLTFRPNDRARPFSDSDVAR